MFSRVRRIHCNIKLNNSIPYANMSNQSTLTVQFMSQNTNTNNSERNHNQENQTLLQKITLFCPLYLNTHSVLCSSGSNEPGLKTVRVLL